MLNRTLFSRLVPIAAVAALLIAGCNETPYETSEDVAQARKDASQDLGEAREEASQTENRVEEKVADARHEYAETDATARAELTEAQSEALSKTAKADFDVAITEAKGIEDVAIEQCGMLSGAEKTTCLNAADAAFAASKAKATADRDAALLVAARDQ
jgi:hypothetical protein